MQCRRWWIAASVMAMVLIGGGMAQAARGADIEQLVRELGAAHGKDAVDKKDEIIAGAKGLDPTAQNAYAVAVCQAIENQKLLESKNADTQAIAVITVVELNALNTDGFLIRALTNANPAVRYWAAKGLGQIMDRLRRAAASGAAVKALQGQLKVETSGIVKAQILNAIALSGDFKEVLAAAKRLEADMKAKAPDAGTIDAARTAVDALDFFIEDADSKGTPLPKADCLDAATVTTHLASYAAQGNHNLNDKKVLPPGNQDAARYLAESGVKLLNAVGKTKISLPAAKSTDGPDELLLEVNSVMGSKSIGDGEIQKTLPEVTIPETIDYK